MPAGPTQIIVKDANGNNRGMEVWSSDGTQGGNLSPLQGILGADQATIATSANGFPVTVENASLAVTGTFWQATQPVSGTVTANAGSGTFAVSAASLPLPSGAATAAKQPALGTAGTPSADVLSVQGHSSMTALVVDGSAVTQPVSGASASFVSGAFAAGAIVDIGTGVSPAANTVNARLVTINTTLGTPMQATGGTVGLVAGTALVGKFGIDQTTPGTTNAVSLAQVGATTVAAGAGAVGAGSQRVAVAQDATTAAGMAPAAIGAGAAPANGIAVLGQYNSSPLTLTNTQSSAVQLDANGFIKVNIAAGAAAGGTSSTFAAAFPSVGTAIGLKNGANMVNGIADASGNMGVTVSNGANIAAVKAASTAPLATDPALVVSISPNSTNANGSATSANSAPVVIASDQVAVAIKAASGTIASGAVASGAFASGALASGSVASGAVASGAFASGAIATGGIVDLGTATTPAAGTANASLQTLAGAVTGSVVQSNTKQVNGVTVLTGTGAVGTGAQRVAVGTDTATIAGSAPGTAGSASSNVVTVQGVASMTPVIIDGATASGSSVANPPVTIGGRAATANPTAVADGQVVNTMHDKEGKLVAVGAIRTLKGTQNTIITASTAETTIVTQIASTFADLYGLILANTGATTTKVDIRDTTGGSIIATLEVPTLETRGFMLPVDSAIAQTTVNTNWTAQCASSTSSLQVTALFVKNI